MADPTEPNEPNDNDPAPKKGKRRGKAEAEPEPEADSEQQETAAAAETSDPGEPAPKKSGKRRGKAEAEPVAEAVAAQGESEPAEAEAEAPPAEPAPSGKKGGKRRTKEAHAQAATEEPAVEETAAAALEVAENEAAEALAEGESVLPEPPVDDTPAVGEGHEPPERLKSIIESLVFAADKPLSVRRLQELTGERDDGPIQGCLEALRADYGDRGVVLHEVAGGWQFRTNPLNAHWVQQLIAGKPVRLSRAQLETLAICAYRQPITRPEIDEIRGVDSGATLKLLLDRSLIRILGKKEEAGRPMLYGTTKDFLTFFNLNDLKELPTLREFYELNEDSMKKIRELDERRAAEGLPMSGEAVPEAAAAAASEAPATVEAAGSEEPAAEASAPSEAPVVEASEPSEAPAAEASAASEEVAAEAPAEDSPAEPEEGPAAEPDQAAAAEPTDDASSEASEPLPGESGSNLRPETD